jgi:peptidoglycan/LPS O-acetylase OafA/YrhL
MWPHADRALAPVEPTQNHADAAGPHLAHPKYRADIDGLRAVAVLSVVAYHAFPRRAPGGFLGVDVFFVISGFLISTIVFGSLERGSFSFVEFYVRRVRRIFPALVAVLGFSLALGWVALLPGEFQQLGKHVAGAAGFASNYVLWNESGYFDAAAETKPLLHLWSLGIEEQFYIAYPLILWLVWRARLNPLTVAVLLAAASFGLNLRDHVVAPVAAFYSPQTRFWELLAGSILAYISISRPPAWQAVRRKADRLLRSAVFASHGAPARPRPEPVGTPTLDGVMSFAGLLLLACGFWSVTARTPFPGWWALAPALAAVLLIAAGGQAPVNRWVLSNRVLVWFGLISFPLYLWHWVLLSFVRIVAAEPPSRSVRAGAVALSVLAAWMTYTWVERPLRFGGRARLRAAALLVAMAAVGAAGYTTFARGGFPGRISGSEVRFSGGGPGVTPGCPEKFGPAFRPFCLSDDLGAAPEVMVIGDSNAHNVAEGLRQAVSGKRMLMLGRGGCPPLLGVTTRLVEGEQHCEEVVEPALRYATGTPSVKTVVLAMGPGYLNKKRSLLYGGFIELHAVGGADVPDPGPVFRDGLRRTLDALVGAGKRVILVIGVPRLTFEPARCADVRPIRFSAPPCSVPRAIVDEDQREYRAAVAAVLQAFPQVLVHDLAGDLCDGAACHAKKGNLVVYADDVHISTIGAEYLMRAMLSRLSLD